MSENESKADQKQSQPPVEVPVEGRNVEVKLEKVKGSYAPLKSEIPTPPPPQKEDK